MENKKRPGRPKKEPTTTVSWRVPTTIAEPLKIQVNKIIINMKKSTTIIALAIATILTSCSNQWHLGTKPNTLHVATRSGSTVTFRELGSVKYVLLDSANTIGVGRHSKKFFEPLRRTN